MSENLLKRNFIAQKPNPKWMTDITCVYVNSQWMYLIVVMDLYCRAITGCSLESQMAKALICDAIDMAFLRRPFTRGMVVHSDRGVQYRSHRYRQKLGDHGCRISMSRRSNCWDNAAMGYFFSRLKVELIFAEKFSTLEEARRKIFEYIEIFYNSERRHSAIGSVSPMQYEQLVYN